MKTSWIGVALLASAVSCLALDSSDLLFHLSFEDGVPAEFARGGSQPVALPEGLPQRLVEGAIGKGYLFAGKGSTLEYLVGDQGGRRCAEMYGPRANLFADAGTFACWVKILTNSNNQTHVFFATEPWTAAITRNEFWQYSFNYANGGAMVAWDDSMYKSPWHFYALTWRKNETCAYLNGRLANRNTSCGVATQPVQKIRLASQSSTNVAFQTKVCEDDTILDEVMLFRRPLTAEEIRSLFERAHITTKHLTGDGGLLPTPPERVYGGHALVAPAISTPLVADGKLEDWKGVPAHGCLTERRVAVLDDDASQVYVAHDAQNLYLAFRCPVDQALHDDPTHVLYPTSEFLSQTSARDGDVYADDYVEFALRGKDGHIYRFAMNAKGALLDSRDGDNGWNAEARFASRSDYTDWTAEIAVPLAQLGVAVGDVVDFNVIRSWKLFKSSQTSLCQDPQCQPGWGKLTLGSGACASLESLGKPAKGELAARGTIVGHAGNYRVKVHGKGLGQEFTEEQTVTVAAGPAPYEVKKHLAKPGDLAVVVEIADPAGSNILTRTVPFVFVPVSAVELMKYPGWGRLEVRVSPIDPNGVHATVALVRGPEEVARQEIPKFVNPDMVLTFDTKPLAMGEYQVVTRLLRGETLVGEDRQPYSKQPLPEWYHGTVGVPERAPTPWSDVKVHGQTVRLTLKDVVFHKTLFPSQIVANDEKLLAAPIRLRVKRGGQDKTITAGDFKIVKQTPVRADWTATARDGELQIKVDGWIAYDGFTWMEITLLRSEATEGKPPTIDHLALEIPFRPESATLQTVDGATRGYVGDKPLKGPAQNGGCWIGNEKAALGYFWEQQRDWVWNNETPTLTPAPSRTNVTMAAAAGEAETVFAVPFIQKTTDLAKPRSYNFGWGLAPFKPVRPDRRIIQLYKGVTYAWSIDYSMTTPNYPKLSMQLPRDEKYLKQLWAELAKPDSPILGWYAFGDSAWPGSPEYAEWWREWRFTPNQTVVPPDPNSKWIAPVCPNSSAMDLHVWLLDKYVKQYPQRAIYFDCMASVACDNEAHGCGYVADDGTRRPVRQILSERRFYERIYNVMKSVDPKYGWVRHHVWDADFSLWSFCDDDWVGEAYADGPLAADPKHNYYTLLDLPRARMLFANKRWGTEVSFLTEMGVSASVVPAGAETFYGKVVTPAKDGQPGEMVLPWLPSYEHVAGLGLVHDMWQLGGNDLELPWMWLQEMERMMRWDDKVQFVGYWELGDRLDVQGGVKDKIVCSVYYRPANAGLPQVPELRSPRDPERYQDFGVPDATKAYLRGAGESQRGWLMFAPMNNTDEDITVTLRPNLKKLGFAAVRDGKLRDLYRAFDWTWHMPTGDKANTPFRAKGSDASFAFTDGAAQVTIPKRNFRMLLLENTDAPPKK